MKRTISAVILAVVLLSLLSQGQSVADKLLPISWADRELAEYRFRYPSGWRFGTLITSVEPGAGDPQKLVLESRYSLGGDNSLSRTEVRADSMEVVSQRINNTSNGDSRTDYSSRQARLQTEGEPPKTIELPGPIFTYEELPFLFRRLPLAPGYKTTLPVITKANVPTRFELTVMGIEEVRVPAGTFYCYKLQLQFQLNETRQFYWIEADQPRLFVKSDANGFRTELVNVGKVDLVNPVDYHDAVFGLALTAPPGWIVQPQYTFEDETMVSIQDPEARAFTRISAIAGHTEKSAIDQQLRAQMNEKIRQYAEGLQGYHVRPDSITMRPIGQNQVLSCIADYVEGEHKMVHYLNWMRSENTIAQFNATVRASDFAKFRESYDRILETVRIK
ncbi:MAG: DUF3108 domain-containing protein [Acidobacteriia bacterium]|nr:DUF3108 domain-containing protein [Terriglobia bacterium]